MKQELLDGDPFVTTTGVCSVCGSHIAVINNQYLMQEHIIKTHKV